MAKRESSTRADILDAAGRLFYAEGIRAVSVDAVAAAASVTKRTLYYHFTSKDELIAEYLTARDQPNLNLFRRWFEAEPGRAADKVRAIFTHVAAASRHPKWRGCGFLRTGAELANMPGHPAVRIGAAHKRKFEDWLARELGAAAVREPQILARQLQILLDGAFATTLINRDSDYILAAGDAAYILVAQRQAG